MTLRVRPHFLFYFSSNTDGKTSTMGLTITRTTQASDSLYLTSEDRWNSSKEAEVSPPHHPRRRTAFVSSRWTDLFITPTHDSPPTPPLRRHQILPSQAADADMTISIHLTAATSCAFKVQHEETGRHGNSDFDDSTVSSLGLSMRCKLHYRTFEALPNVIPVEIAVPANLCRSK